MNAENRDYAITLRIRTDAEEEYEETDEDDFMNCIYYRFMCQIEWKCRTKMNRGMQMFIKR